MGGFEFPKNVKQIGTIENGMKIYIEDYVYTYLSQYAEGSGYDERLAFLVGRGMIIDGQSVLFISGCIQSMYCVFEKGIVSFSDKSWSYAKEQLKRYFNDLQIVGWMQSQPGYGIHLNSNYANYHLNNFIHNDHVLFVVDPIEKVNAFYIWNEKSDDIVETKGYFIYYDKNRSMHEYMLDHRIASKINLKDVPITKEDLKRKEKIKERPVLSIQKKKYGSIEEPVDKNAEKHFETEKYFKPIIKERQAVRAAKYSASKQKRVVNMLVSLGAVMVIISFVMGAGLIQNLGRITSLERQLTQLSTAYRDLLLQISDGASSSVFAAGTDNEDDIVPASENSGDTTAWQDKQQPVPTAALIPTPQPPSPSPTPAPTETPSPQPTVTPEPQPTETPSPQPTVTPEPQAEAENETIAAAEESAEPTSQAAAETDLSLIYDLSRVPDTYLIQEGDNLSYISQKFYGDRSMVAKIMELNGFTDPNKVYFGTVITLPK